MQVFPLHIFGSISYWHELLKSDAPIIDIGENYVKQTGRNRFAIAGAHGMELLTLNVKGLKGKKVALSQVELADDFQAKLLLRSMDTAYGKSPFYEHYRDEVHELVLGSGNLLIDISKPAFHWIEEQLEMDKVLFSEEYVEDFQEDFRGSSFKESSIEPYGQTFEDRNGFVDGLSILDALFHLGPELGHWLRSQE